jgi:hypothetical protein
LEKERGKTMRMTALVALVAVSAAAVTDAQTRGVDFTQDRVGQPPRGFEFGLTAKEGAPGRWVIQAEGENKFLAQLDADSTRSRFPTAVLADVRAADVDLSVRFRPVSGQVDRAAGLVWRYRDENNYYIVRANALENNVVPYKVQNGKRTDLPIKGEGRTYGKPSQVPSGQWATLRVVAKGPLFEVYHNDRKLYEVEDATFTQAGKVGVWTKADSITHFDDLRVVTK